MARQRTQAPIDHYALLSALLGWCVLCVAAPDFTTGVFKGQVNWKLLEQGIQQRTEQVKGAIASVTAAGDAGFETALKQTLKWEGSSCESHPADQGGLTCKGILDSEYRTWRKSQNLPEQSVEQMTDEEMRSIYKGYWDRCKAGDLPAPLSFAVFDSCVNFDENKIKDWFENLPSDPKAAAIELMNRRIAYRHQRVAEMPSQGVFLQGWLNRDNDFKAFVEAFQSSNSSEGTTTPGVAAIPTTQAKADPGQSVVKILSGSEVSSGVAIAPNRIITVTHGLKHPDSIRIQTIDGKQLQGKLVKSDRSVDLALLEVNGSLPAAPLGEMPRPGDSVRSVGYSYGKRASKKLQVIAAAETARQITVTAGLAPGDSGGGLFNQSGQLAGVARAIDAQDGVGKAIPSATVQSFVQIPSH